MANVILATPSQNQQWSTKFVQEYLRKSTYAPFMSTTGDNIIRVENKLNNEAGTLVHIPLFGKLRGTPNDGTTSLVGNEIALNNYSVALKTKLVRQAVNVQITQEVQTEIQLRTVAKQALDRYAAELLKNDMIAAFNAIPVKQSGDAEDIVKNYSDATAAELNLYCSNNVDRLLFVGGSNTGTMSTSLASVTAAGGVLNSAAVDAAKNLLEQSTLNSTFAIEPYQTKDGQEWHVLFVNPTGFAALRADTQIFQSTKDAAPRGDDNPLFTGGDLIWNGVIIKKQRDYGNLGAVGGGGSKVAQAHLCGVNAVAMGYSMKTRPTLRNEDDYQLNKGVGFMEYRGQTKMSVAGLQTGMVTIFHTTA